VAVELERKRAKFENGVLVGTTRRTNKR
jgi:hypothetical protein